MFNSSVWKMNYSDPVNKNNNDQILCILFDEINKKKND